MHRPGWIAVFLLRCILITVDGHVTSYTTDESHADLPVVTWWEPMSDLADYVISCQAEQRCVVSRNRTTPRQQEVMVYIFYGTLFLSNGLPLPRKAGDLWALIHEESPKNADWLFTFASTMEVFNYTSTFQRRSDYPIPTHWLANEESLLSKKYVIPTDRKNILRREGGLAPVIFVHTDCSTPSNREQYVKMLQKYIPIDSYGPCLHNKDYPEEFQHLDGIAGYMSEDFLKLVARYKFAIAFENAICEDYITEKLWRPLQVGTVPIVRGSPKVKEFLPSNKSAILMEDFRSITELAEFIKHLDQNDEEYESYLTFKDVGISNPTLISELSRQPPAKFVGETFAKALVGYECFLCDKLHEALEVTASGQPVPRAQANLMNCPLPTTKFDENGQTVPDPLRDRESAFYHINAKLFRESYDIGKSISAHDLYLAARQRWEDAEMADKDEL